MLLERRYYARADVTGDANLQGNLALGEFGEQGNIRNGGNAVADSLGSDLQGGSNRLWAYRFARVSHQVQASLARLAKAAFKPLRRAALLEASDPERDH